MRPVVGKCTRVSSMNWREHLALRFSLAVVGIMILAFVVVKLSPYWRPASVLEARVQATWSAITGGDGAALERKAIAEEGFPEQPHRYQEEYDFSEDWFTRSIRSWNVALTSYKGRSDIHYLEIGVFEGGSVMWMLENILTHPSSRLTVIDPFTSHAGHDVEQIFLDNLKKSGAADRTTVIKGFSQEELGKLPAESYDIIYVDGSHDADDVLEDAVLSWRLLKVGGLLIFDDYEILEPASPQRRPKLAITAFVRCYRRELKIIHRGYQVIVQKAIRQPGKSGSGPPVDTSRWHQLKVIASS